MTTESSAGSGIRDELAGKIRVSIPDLDYSFVTREHMESYANWTSAVQITLVATSTFASAAITAFVSAQTIAVQAREPLSVLALGLGAAAIVIGAITFLAYRTQKRARDAMWQAAEAAEEGGPSEDVDEELRRLRAMNQHLLRGFRREMIRRRRLEQLLEEQREREQEEVDIFGEADEADDEFGPIPEGEDIFGDQ